MKEAGMSETATGGAGDRPVMLEMRDITRRFSLARGFLRRETLTAVDHVSLTIRRGDILGIVGESGSGKTTLSKIMLGLLAPSEGEVLLEGSPLAQFGRKNLARRMQFVFQDPYSSLNPRRSIGSIVTQPLRIHGIGNRTERESQARKLLDVVGLPARVYDAAPGQLSGGQRQRVVIARALALRPALLICDEPTSALDVSVQAQILNLLLDLRSEFDLTYVMVSHNLSVIEHMATEVAVMYRGRIVEHAPTAEIFRAPAHPYTRVLLRSAMTIAPDAGIPDVGFDRSDPAFGEPVPSRITTQA